MDRQSRSLMSAGLLLGLSGALVATAGENLPRRNPEPKTPKPEPEVNNSRQARRWRARHEFKRLPRKA